MAIKVFVSAGTPGNDIQKSFRDSVISAIELAGLSPRVMSDRDWDYKNPLRGIRRAMEECSGTMVIAYARYQFPAGVEIRRGGGRPLQDIEFPTPWNQIEAAMAYERGLPLLVVADSGLRRDAVFEATNDIRPFLTDITTSIQLAAGFQGYLHSWKQDVEAFAASSEARLSETSREVSIKHLFSTLPWYEALGLAGTILGALAGAATVGYRIGTGVWPLG
jgi:hypothetical protein